MFQWPAGRLAGGTRGGGSLGVVLIWADRAGAKTNMPNTVSGKMQVTLEDFS